MSTVPLQPSLNHVHCPDASGGHRMAYWQWGNPRGGQVIVCVHGMSRQGRDFDVLAQALCERGGSEVRVVCPDVVGRGQSDWLADPMGYQIPTYAADMLALLRHLKPVTLDWMGTSMGGLIAIALFGQPQLALPVPLRRLLLNDVGPVVQWAFMERLKTYLGNTGRFASVQQAADVMWAISTSFGPHTPAQWLALSRPMVKPMADEPDLFTLHYDPALAIPVRALTPEVAAQGEALLWQLFDNLRADTLLVRGAQSDLLTEATALAMTQRGPKARLVTFEGVGHAPTFVANDQVDTGARFLLGQ